MKLFKHMREARRGRVAPRVGRTLVEFSAELDDPSSQKAEGALWRRVYTVTVGCSLIGPEEASENMAEKAKRMIARELYGELEDDIRDAIEVANEEAYRPENDPLLKVLEGMLRKVRGDE